MDGHEFIKVYDHVLPVWTHAGLLGLYHQMGGTVQLKDFVDLDGVVFNSIVNPIHQYTAEFPYLTHMHSFNLDDTGYEVLRPGSESECGLDTVEKSSRVATLFVFLENTGEIHFPLHGIKICAKPGRMVIFPSYWTHPYTFTESGIVMRSNLVYPNK